MSGAFITCFLMYPLSSGFRRNIHNSLVSDKSLAGGPRFALQFYNIMKDLDSFDTSALSYPIS